MQIITRCREEFDYVAVVVWTDGYGIKSYGHYSHLSIFLCFVYPMSCNISSSHDLFILFISFLTGLHTFGHPFYVTLIFFFMVWFEKLMVLPKLVHLWE